MSDGASGPKRKSGPGGARPGAGRPRGSTQWSRYEPTSEARAKLMSAFEPIDPNVETPETALTVLERNMVMHATLGSRIIGLAGQAQKDPNVDRKDALWMMELGFKHREIAGKTAIAILPYRHARISPVVAKDETDDGEVVSPTVEPVVIEDIGKTLDRVRKKKGG
jgi:hypothetical protein